MNCQFHVHAKMSEVLQVVSHRAQSSNVEDHRLVLRCNMWADHAQTRRCPHMAVIYLPSRNKLCVDCGCIVSFEQKSQGRKRCCSCETAYRKKTS